MYLSRRIRSEASSTNIYESNLLRTTHLFLYTTQNEKQFLISSTTIYSLYCLEFSVCFFFRHVSIPFFFRRQLLAGTQSFHTQQSPFS